MPEKKRSTDPVPSEQPEENNPQGGTIQSAWNGVQSILNHLVDSLNRLKTVQVTTLASDLELITQTDPATKQTNVVGVQPLAGASSAKVEGLVTEIDMLQGDIRHFRSSEMQPVLESQLKEVHARHVEMAQKIFLDNVKFAADTVHRFWQNEQ